MPRRFSTRVANVIVPDGEEGNMNGRTITTAGTVFVLNDAEYAALSPRAIYDATNFPNGVLNDLGPTDTGLTDVGVKVSRAAANLPQTASTTYFTVSGGRVRLLHIQGEVTTVVQTQANNTKLEFDPAGSLAVTDLSAVVDMTAATVGSLLSIVGVAATALQKNATGILLPAQILPAQGLVLPAGDIKLNCAASNTGQTKWDVWYIPLDDGATVAAA